MHFQVVSKEIPLDIIESYMGHNQISLGYVSSLVQLKGRVHSLQ